MAHITPQVPIRWYDDTAVIIYYKGPSAINTTVIEGAITAFAGHLPKPAVVAQFFDWVTETDLLKWLIAFDTADAAIKFS
jgi:hypothetical protein